MRHLLDSHTFLWLAHNSSSLSRQARAAISDADNILYLSLASVWELQIKAQLGKLEFKKPLVEIIREQQNANRIELFPIALAHIFGLSDLPSHHQDPFDRMLIAQARHENIAILTKDPQIARYPVSVIW